MKALARRPEAPPLILAPGAVTIDALVPQFLRWLKFVRERRENTVLAYGHDLANFLRFGAITGLRDPAAIKPRHVELYMAWLRQERKVTTATANRHLHALRTFYTYLIREEACSHNPAAAAFMLKASRRLIRYLTIPEQELVLETLVRDHSALGQRDLGIVAVMLFCGLRVSEVVNLTLDDVDIENATLRVQQGKTAGSTRELPIIPRLRGLLRAYLSDGRPRLAEGVYGHVRPVGPWSPYWRMEYRGLDGRLVCCTTWRTTREAAEAVLAAHAPARPAVEWFFVAGPIGRRGGPRAVEPLLTRSVFQVIRDKVSPIIGKPIHPHALRHSFASRLRENGAPLELIKEAMGHSDIRTTLIYARISTSKRREDLTTYLEGHS